MRYFLLAPMVVLAMVACAKRDSEFAKRAADAKTGANKVTTKASPSPSASPATSVSPNPSVSPAPTADKDLYKGDTENIAQDHCDNPFKMELQEGETKLELSDLLKEEKGTYVLKSTEFFVEYQAKNGKVISQVHATGSEFASPEEFKSPATVYDKIVPICHTAQDKIKEGKVISARGSIQLPNEFQIDGSVKILRKDKFEAANALIKVTSTLSSADANIKTMIGAEKPTGTTDLILRKDNSSDVVIKINYTKTDAAGLTGSVWMSGTYSLSLKK
jgi:hypothetical protein